MEERNGNVNDPNIHTIEFPAEAVKEAKPKTMLGKLALRNKRSGIKHPENNWVIEESHFNEGYWRQKSQGGFIDQVQYDIANTFYAGPQTFVTSYVQNLDGTFSITSDERIELGTGLIMTFMPSAPAVSGLKYAKPLIKTGTSGAVQKSVLRQTLQKVGCFTGETTVVTSEGDKEIREIELGDLVATSL